jgi:hypothetical protein
MVMGGLIPGLPTISGQRRMWFYYEIDPYFCGTVGYLH